MTPQKKAKYPGDAAMEAFLRKHGCPLPFAVVRMRFLGAVASLQGAASPAAAIETCWNGALPAFDDEAEAEAFHQTLLSLWNRMARHQAGVLVKLVKPKKLRDGTDVVDVLRLRAAEIRDGFLTGFGDPAGAPAELRQALADLENVAKRLEETAAGLEGAETAGLPVADYRQGIETATREVESLLTTIVRASKDLRGQVLRAGASGGRSRLQ